MKPTWGRRETDSLVTKVVADDELWIPQLCSVEPSGEPCAMVIFGASGDLTKRKLMPALFKLSDSKLLNKDFFIIGAGRTKMGDEEFRRSLMEAAGVSSMKKRSRTAWERFSKRIFYHSFEYGDTGAYEALSRKIVEREGEKARQRNRLFYLATPPSLYGTISGNLGSCGLADEGQGWSRIVIEKPFGRSLSTARQLNTHLHRYFAERQVFRIDHYLGKETVQDILMFRFANTIFDPVWNRQYIDNIQITSAETLGIENRAGYYEQAGVLRDMFQNHMMQLLALTAMEPPVVFAADDVRDEKGKVFRAIKPFSLDSLHESIVLGQYRGGSVEGEEVPGYLDEPGVAKRSRTPTFAAMRFFIDNWRWSGVPFYLRSGKRMPQRFTEVVIQFKGVPHLMFHKVMGDTIGPNFIILRIQPDEGIKLVFQVKLPGSKVCLRSVKMDFTYKDFYQGTSLEAYERVLLDCILGDHTLFVREDGVDTTWALLTPLLEVVESRKGPRYPLYRYGAGSWGPPEADALLEGDGNRWVALS